MTENYVTVANLELARVFLVIITSTKASPSNGEPQAILAKIIKTITFDRNAFLLKRLQKERKIGGGEKSLTLYILYMFMPYD